MEIVDLHQILLDTMWVERCTIMAEIICLIILILFNVAFVFLWKYFPLNTL